MSEETEAQAQGAPGAPNGGDDEQGSKFHLMYCTTQSKATSLLL
jgi:hypothetical protein